MPSSLRSLADSFLNAIPKPISNDFLLRVLERRPVSLSIELVNICNADCTFCAYRYQKRPKGIIKDEVYQRAIEDYCAMGGGQLGLTPTVGEPLLDRKLLERVRFARGKKEIGSIHFFTNLLHLHHFQIKEFLLSGITDLRISACIKDEKTYRQVFRAEGYPQLIKNIVTLCETNRSLNNPVRIELQLRVPKPFEEVFGSDDYKRIISYFRPEEVELEAHEFHGWGDRIGADDLPAGHSLSRSKPLARSVCVEMYRKMNVLYDGTVNFCVCRDIDAEFSIGNIRDRSLAELWLGFELNQFRERWQQGIYPAMCLKCDRYRPVDKYIDENKAWLLKLYLKEKLSFAMS